MKFNRRAAAIGSFAAVLLVGGGGIAFGLRQRGITRAPLACAGSGCTPLARPSPVPTAAPTPIPVPVLRRLDGVAVVDGSDRGRPLAVMIENHPDARPQSGLASASVVYEAQTEGGITRFMALYPNDGIDRTVGPVRSARTYFVAAAREYGSLYAHVGGNADALEMVRSGPTYDLDQFEVGTEAFRRDTSRPVATEHTMYASTDRLRAYSEAHGAVADQSFKGWTYGPAAPGGRPAALLRINFSSPSYAVNWEYDASASKYVRSMAGKPHADVSGARIRASTVIVQKVTRIPTTDGYGRGGAYTFDMASGGSADVYRDGTAYTGRWSKDGEGRTRFTDAAGTELPLSAGPVWVEIVHPGTPVS